MPITYKVSTVASVELVEEFGLMLDKLKHSWKSPDVPLSVSADVIEYFGITDIYACPEQLICRKRALVFSNIESEHKLVHSDATNTFYKIDDKIICLTLQ